MAASRIPRIETMIITVFFLGIALWAINKCTASRHEVVSRIKAYSEADAEDRPQKPDTLKAPVTSPAPSPQVSKPIPEPNPKETPVQEVKTVPTPGRTPSKTTKDAPEPVAKPSTATTTKSTSAASTKAANGLTTLFVSIDGLKMRKEPGLKGDLVAKLKLYEPVYFLNKKTDWTQEISLGYEKVTDHWVKVRTQSGKEGWVFGAGVHYFKTKRKGVMK